MSLKELLGNVIDALTGHDERQEQNDVQPASQDPYGDPADRGAAPQSRYPGGVQPSSQDPFGDPADQAVQPASQDPYGDPADNPNVLPSSQDPFGDPADQEQRARR